MHKTYRMKCSVQAVGTVAIMVHNQQLPKEEKQKVVWHF